MTKCKNEKGLSEINNFKTEGPPAYTLLRQSYSSKKKENQPPQEDLFSRHSASEKFYLGVYRKITQDAFLKAAEPCNRLRF